MRVIRIPQFNNKSIVWETQQCKDTPLYENMHHPEEQCM